MLFGNYVNDFEDIIVKALSGKKKEPRREAREKQGLFHFRDIFGITPSLYAGYEVEYSLAKTARRWLCLIILFRSFKS